MAKGNWPHSKERFPDITKMPEQTVDGYNAQVDHYNAGVDLYNDGPAPDGPPIQGSDRGLPIWFCVVMVMMCSGASFALGIIVGHMY